MKFGKKLRATVEGSYEEWRPMFMSYKQLKKCLKMEVLGQGRDVESKDSDSKDREDSDDVNDSDRECLEWRDTPADRKKNEDSVRTAEAMHNQFFNLFKQQVDKVNEFFLDKQEDYIIEHRQLSEKVNEILQLGATTRGEVNRLRQRLTNFHGELVLLENFSTVNYTGFRKILKKHDKKTGLNMRTMYLKTVLATPFFLSDTVRKLVLKTESQLSQLDGITKFRRADSSARPLEPPTSRPRNPPPLPTPAGPSTKWNTAAPVAQVMPLAPMDACPSEEVIIEPPRPRAFISPLSPLWRLYSEGLTFGSTIRHALTIASPSKRLPAPSQSLVDLMDAINPNELGLQAAFLDSVQQPSNYCIAGNEDFSMGVFVIRPKVRLQIFKSHKGGTFITKNLRGRARLQLYETTTTGSASTAPSEHGPGGDVPAEKRDFCVEQTRSGTTVGPWPAVTCNSADMHVQWVPETVCAVFYLCTPALGDEKMPRYDLYPLTPPRFRVVHDQGDMQKFTRVVC
eukprot:GFKZ01010022.1.p1 GENE.GFKZ01010022.1~~GFKZ01010022.1.p1  ORF type:complete len:511 (+),score=57.50 GFKZ01010022.1:74-1606(+)